MKTVVVGITGGIAAYKSAELVSRLKKSGIDVHCIMTKNAQQFLAPLTLETLSGNPVISDMFQREAPWEVAHISLAQKASLFVVAPATANVLGKIAHGVADDMLTTTLMATTAPILIAPAMNNAMYKNAAVQINIATLTDRGMDFIGPESGLLACGDDDVGRMSEPEQIAGRIFEMLQMSRVLDGKNIVVTAGPTVEKIDPVRFISNRSTGKMGYALAEAAKDMGANVTLISGPTNLKVPLGIDVIHVTTTREMHTAVLSHFKDCDALIAAAAPSDFSPQNVSLEKIKKTDNIAIELSKNPDIALDAGKQKTHQKMVIFAAESENVIANAKDKLARKNADLVVANDITQHGAGFGVDTNIVSIIEKDGAVTAYDIMPKSALANIIMDAVARLISL